MGISIEIDNEMLARLLAASLRNDIKTFGHKPFTDSPLFRRNRKDDEDGFIWFRYFFEGNPEINEVLSFIDGYYIVTRLHDRMFFLRKLYFWRNRGEESRTY